MTEAMSLVQEHLLHLPEHGVLICRHCEFAIRPMGRGVRRHLLEIRTQEPQSGAMQDFGGVRKSLEPIASGGSIVFSVRVRAGGKIECLGWLAVQRLRLRMCKGGQYGVSL